MGGEAGDEVVVVAVVVVRQGVAADSRRRPGQPQQLADRLAVPIQAAEASGLRPSPVEAATWRVPEGAHRRGPAGSAGLARLAVSGAPHGPVVLDPEASTSAQEVLAELALSEARLGPEALAGLAVSEARVGPVGLVGLDQVVSTSDLEAQQ